MRARTQFRDFASQGCSWDETCIATVLGGAQRWGTAPSGADGGAVRIQLGGTPMSRAEIRVARASGEWAAGNKTTGVLPTFNIENDHFTKTGSGQAKKEKPFKTHTPVFLQGLEGCLCSGSLARISERGCSHRSLSKLQRVRRWRWRRDGSWSVLLAGYSSGFCAMQRCVSASIHSPQKRSGRGPPKPYLFFDRNSHHLIQKMCIDLARTKFLPRVDVGN